MLSPPGKSRRPGVVLGTPSTAGIRWASLVPGRMHALICTAKLLCCAPETMATLLIGYAPIKKKS